MTPPDDSHPVGISGALALPGVASTTLIFAGISLPDWVCIWTLISIFVGLSYTVWKFYRDIKEAHEEDEDHHDVETLAERHRQPEDE